MAFGRFDAGDETEVMSEINMIPLIDVMLVLLIVFIVTLPMIQQAVKVDLPQAAAPTIQSKPETIRLSIDAEGQYHWNTELVVPSPELAAKFAQAVSAHSDVELHIRADKAVRYERVAQAMAWAQGAGIGKIGFVTQP